MKTPEWLMTLKYFVTQHPGRVAAILFGVFVTAVFTSLNSNDEKFNRACREVCDGLPVLECSWDGSKVTAICNKAAEKREGSLTP
jgi:hypothetical protein